MSTCREIESASIRDRDQVLSEGDDWTRVLKLVDFANNETSQKDRARMREVLRSVKSEA